MINLLVIIAQASQASDILLLRDSENKFRLCWGVYDSNETLELVIMKRTIRCLLNVCKTLIERKKLVELVQQSLVEHYETVLIIYVHRPISNILKLYILKTN